MSMLYIYSPTHFYLNEQWAKLTTVDLELNNDDTVQSGLTLPALFLYSHVDPAISTFFVNSKKSNYQKYLTQCLQQKDKF